MTRWVSFRAILLTLCATQVLKSAVGFPAEPNQHLGRRHRLVHNRKLITAAADPAGLVDTDPLILTYHNGPLLSGGTAPVYLILYGNWSVTQREIVYDFVSSFDVHEVQSPSVADWWSLMNGYRDSTDTPVTANMEIGGEIYDSKYSFGANLKVLDIENLVLSTLTPNGKFPTNHHAVYLVLTSPDVLVEDFCKNQCASHFATKPLNATDGRHLIYTWVGNAVTQCPKKCIWPFAPSEFGPATKALIPPNGDEGVDGMIINIGIMLSGAATNPFNTGYYQGDAGAPLEAATACAGIFGEGAYPGEPGSLLVDQSTGGSYNAHGVNGRKYLLPALWNPLDLECTPPQLASRDV
ncbi:hypothetical protein Mapa_014127 [Marchantia paleacea]|nr:hypothetical protein Mapa_014127 [Marchantia paleacea]